VSVAGIGDAGREELRHGKTGVADPGYNKTETARVSETAPTIAPTDANELWRKILARIPQKGFLRTLTESVTPIGIEGRNFLLGHPPDEKSAIETIASPSNRRQLETLLKETSGRDWTVKFVAKAGIKSTGAGRAPAAESFKDDPLIQEALEIFKGEIKS